jgi:hypothetical protein
LVHLKGKNEVYFDSQEQLEKQMLSGAALRTTLTEFFRLNQLDAIGHGVRVRDLLYQDFPKFFTFTPRKRFKGREKSSDMIGRLYHACINEGERYYLRLLLMQRKGSISFDDLKTVRGVMFPTFREAAEALGLLVLDRHYDSSLSEASSIMPGGGLRFMFCMLLLHSPPANPSDLLDTFLSDLLDDLPHMLRHVYKVSNPTWTMRKFLCYFLMSGILSEYGKSFGNVGLNNITSSTEYWDMFASSGTNLHDTTTHHIDAFLEMSENLSADQSCIIDHVIKLLETSDGALLYIDGPGGCGKTYLLNTIVHYLKASQTPSAFVASSGVAGLMYVDGMTTHLRFKIPLDVTSSLQCHWKP